MAEYVQKGNVIYYDNQSSETIKAGDVVPFGKTRIGIAEAVIYPGDIGTVALTGVYQFSADSTTAFHVGDLVSFDTADNTVKAKADNLPLAGMIVLEKQLSDKKALVRLQ